MNEIKTKSPTRVDLAGGTLDLWPLYTFFDGATTVNVAIDIFTYAEIKIRGDAKIVLRASDLPAEKTYAHLQECLTDGAPEFTLLREHVRFWKPQKGFELTTRSESPVGGGLGGSSSLSISILGAFAKWAGRALTPSEAVEIAHNIEAKVLHVPTGTQDYYPALLGGVNFLKYSHEGCAAEKLARGSLFETISKHFLLIYTGRPHQSGLNNWEVLKQSIEKKGDALEALGRLQAVADDMVQTLRSESWKQIAGLLNREYEARVKLSRVFTSPEIERLKQVALSSKADAVKICGAGGGGCVLLWCPPEEKEKVSRQCQSAGFQVLKAMPIEQGLTVVTS